MDTNRALDLIGQISEWKVPQFIMTGGDPLKRYDLTSLIRECAKRDMVFSLTLPISPLLESDRLQDLKRAGLNNLSISLDGANAETHDRFRGASGHFKRSIEVMRQARELGFQLQIDTIIGRHNYNQVEDIARGIRDFFIDPWYVFFPNPKEIPDKSLILNDMETEVALHVLYDILCNRWFNVKVVNVPHFRRVILQRNRLTPDQMDRAVLHHPNPEILEGARDVNDGRGFVFISHSGDVLPSNQFHIPCGNIKEKRLSDIYQTHPFFLQLRNSDLLQGKCGYCVYRYLCGGSRSRSYAMTGDFLAADPFCAYKPEEVKIKFD